MIEVETNECVTFGRVIEFTADEALGVDSALLRAAADWLGSPAVARGQIYEKWVMVSTQVVIRNPGSLTLQVVILPEPVGQSIEDAVSGPMGSSD